MIYLSCKTFDLLMLPHNSVNFLKRLKNLLQYVFFNILLLYELFCRSCYCCWIVYHISTSTIHIYYMYAKKTHIFDLHKITPAHLSENTLIALQRIYWSAFHWIKMPTLLVAYLVSYNIMHKTKWRNCNKKKDEIKLYTHLILNEHK